MKNPPLPPPDKELPALHTLLGSEAPSLLAPALGIAPNEIETVEATQVRYRPERSVAVAYAMTVAGVESPLIVGAHSGRAMPAGPVVVGDGETQVAVWQFPDDPMLPGLAAASQPESLVRLLAEVGINEPVQTVRTRTYRPLTRAVLEVRTERHRLFVKVVRPSRVAALQRVHQATADQVRVPRSHGWSPELGLAILEAIPGITMRQAAARSGSERLPGPKELSELLDRLPSLPRQRPALRERLDGHVRFLTAILPELGERLAAVAADIASAPEVPAFPAHNDFHSAQVMLSGGRISGLVDIDTIGEGARADDYALLLGHLFTIALANPPRATRLASYGAELLAGFEREVDRATLRLRTAAAVVAFATGPFRRQQPDWPAATLRRLEAAQDWVDRS